MLGFLFNPSKFEGFFLALILLSESFYDSSKSFSDSDSIGVYPKFLYC